MDALRKSTMGSLALWRLVEQITRIYDRRRNHADKFNYFLWLKDVVVVQSAALDRTRDSSNFSLIFVSFTSPSTAQACLLAPPLRCILIYMNMVAWLTLTRLHGACLDLISIWSSSTHVNVSTAFVHLVYASFI